MAEGVLHGPPQGQCAHGKPGGRVWFTVVVEVSTDNVKISSDGNLVTQYRPYFTGRGNVGVLIPNGYDQTIRMKSATLRGESLSLYLLPKSVR